MSKVKILQKLDSIVFEADRLYCYMNASQVTKNLFKENYGISITDTAFLTYTIKDTLKCIQHQAESDIIYEAVFELEEEILSIKAGEGVHILPGKVHKIKNDTKEEIEFLVISEPHSHGDKIIV